MSAWCSPAPAAIALSSAMAASSAVTWHPACLELGAQPFERRLILASQRAETGQRVRYEGRAGVGVVGDPFDQPVQRIGDLLGRGNGVEDRVRALLPHASVMTRPRRCGPPGATAGR